MGALFDKIVANTDNEDTLEVRAHKARIGPSVFRIAEPSPPVYTAYSVEVQP